MTPSCACVCRTLATSRARTCSSSSESPTDRAEQAGDLAAELVALGVDTILTTGLFSAEAARAATSTLPIVMVYPGDPVIAGLVSSLARPGGNVTGVTDFQPQLITKRLELLKEAAPSISRVALPLNPDVPRSIVQPGGTLQVAAQTLGLELVALDVRTPGDLDAALDAATRAGVDAVFWVGGGGNFRSAEFGTRLIALAAQYRSPAICGYLEWAQAGVLLADAPNYPAQLRRAVDYVDKILKGASAGLFPRWSSHASSSSPSTPGPPRPSA